MNRRTIVCLGAFAAIAASAPADAQKKAVRPATARSAPPAQPIVVNTTGLPMVSAGPSVQVVPGNVPNSTGLHTNFVPPVMVPVNPVGVAQITYYPTLVLSDGRVVANFGTGRGYEQVLRQCPQALPPNATIAPCWTADAYGNYRVIQRR